MRLVDAQRKNHEDLLKAFWMTDAHLYVLKMVAIDIVEDKVAKTEEGGVDLRQYYEAFNSIEKAKIEATNKAKAEAAEAAKKQDEGPEPEEFGGDAHAST